jgi:hypothetical protein
MKIADILRTLANNLEHAEGGTPDPRIQNPGQLIDVAVVAEPVDADAGNKTASGNDANPEELFLPPLQQKQELLKKAVGVENVYDDGTPAEKYQEEKDSEDDMSQERDDIVDRIKKLSGVPTAAIQELANDGPLDD